MEKNKQVASIFLNLFKGRLRRLDYFLLNLLGIIAVGIINSIFLVLLSSFVNMPAIFYSCFIIFNIVIISMLMISGTVRRLHDIKMSGFWIFILFVPIVSIIFGFLLLFKKGTDGLNKYGEINSDKNFFQRILNLNNY